MSRIRVSYVRYATEAEALAGHVAMLDRMIDPAAVK